MNIFFIIIVFFVFVFAWFILASLFPIIGDIIISFVEDVKKAIKDE